MQILEQHDAHVGAFVRYRQRIRWDRNTPVCFDCGNVRILGMKPMTAEELDLLAPRRRPTPAPLWTLFRDGWAFRVCPDCYRAFYEKETARGTTAEGVSRPSAALPPSRGSG